MRSRATRSDVVPLKRKSPQIMRFSIKIKGNARRGFRKILEMLMCEARSLGALQEHHIIKKMAIATKGDTVHG